MQKKSKLGRNPLEKLSPMQKAEVTQESMKWPGKYRRPPTVLEKIKEMQVQVNWSEFIDQTLGESMRKISRLW